jgi:hypothetical protein
MRAFILLALMMVPAVFAIGDQPVRVFVNGVERKCSPPAIMRDGQTYIPLRGAGEALGAKVKWDEKTSTAMITLGNKRARISQAKGIMVEGSLLLPLRTMGEALNCTVKWDGKKRAVHLSQKRCTRPG